MIYWHSPLYHIIAYMTRPLATNVNGKKCQTYQTSKSIVWYQDWIAVSFSLFSIMLGSSTPKASGSRWTHQWWHVLVEVPSPALRSRPALTQEGALSKSTSRRCRMSRFFDHAALSRVPQVSPETYPIRMGIFNSGYIWMLLTNHGPATIIRTTLFCRMLNRHT